MTDPVPGVAEPHPHARGSAIAGLRIRVMERATRFAKAHEVPLLLLVAGLSLLAYLWLGPAPAIPQTAAATSGRTEREAGASGSRAFRVHALVSAGRKMQERDARLVLTDSGISVTRADQSRQVLHGVAYDRVRSIAYSHGRDPMWNSPRGPASLRRTGGVLGKLGLFVERHWITLESDTSTRFVILRVDDGLVDGVLAALAERTGRRPDIIGSR